jgi:hypothetical protein
MRPAVAESNPSMRAGAGAGTAPPDIVAAVKRPRPPSEGSSSASGAHAAHATPAAATSAPAPAAAPAVAVKQMRHRWFLAAIDRPFDLIEVDRGVFTQYSTRTGHVLTKDPPVGVDPKTGARIWRVPYTRTVALALYQTLLHGELCMEGIEGAELHRALEYENVHVPGAATARLMLRSPTIVASRAPKPQCAAEQMRKVGETVANALCVWPRLECGMRAATLIDGSGRQEFSCSPTRVWLRFVQSPPTNYPGKDALHALAQRQPRWLSVALVLIGQRFGALGEGKSGADGVAERDEASFRELSGLVRADPFPLLATWYDVPHEQRQQQARTPEMTKLAAAIEFSTWAVAQVRGFGPIVSAVLRDQATIELKFARACCALANEMLNGSPDLCNIYGGALADDGGETPERKALGAALLRRKVRIKKWAEEPPRGVVPLVFPPALRPDGQTDALRGPCALLEF